MPNIITHYLFAKEVKTQTDSDILECIRKYPNEFVIGSNGPDFLFFYHFFIGNKEAHFVQNIGSVLHSSNINAFYSSAIDTIATCDDVELKKAMKSYVAGHLCHWALDSTTHPYIFYKTGNCKGESASMHHRFESMLDALMLQKKLGYDIHDFYFPGLTYRKELTLKAISTIYTQAVKDCLYCKLSEKQIKGALDDWTKIQKLLYDPKQVKVHLLKVFEKTIKHPWLFSGNVVPSKIDYSYDILNEAKHNWCYPVDPSRISNESFDELFEKAKKLAVNCIKAMDDKSALLNILSDITYDTGVTGNIEMSVFDLIYKEK